MPAGFFGAAIGNVIRGVPLDSSGYFFEPLWTNFRAGSSPGILAWYTVLTGALALAALALDARRLGALGVLRGVYSSLRFADGINRALTAKPGKSLKRPSMPEAKSAL